MFAYILEIGTINETTNRKEMNNSGYTYTTTDGKAYYVEFGNSTVCKTWDITPHNNNQPNKGGKAMSEERNNILLKTTTCIAPNK